MGSIFGALFWTHFCIQLGSKWGGGLFSKITLPPPSHTLPPSSSPEGDPINEPSSAKALSGTCSGKTDRKVPKVTMAAFEEKMWTRNV